LLRRLHAILHEPAILHLRLRLGVVMRIQRIRIEAVGSFSGWSNDRAATRCQRRGRT
jgi:hypothetical protein